MKRISILLLAIVACFYAQAQTPAVTTTIDNLTPMTITASFEMNESCTSYAILASPTGEMQNWAEGFQMTMEDLVIAWGITYQTDTTYTWTAMTPNTEHEVFVVAWNETDTAEAVITLCTTPNLGGEGASVITIQLSEITATSVRMITTPNDQTAVYYNGLVKTDFYNEVGQDSAMSVIMANPYPLYETDDWVWLNLESETSFYALAQGQNANGEWGEVAATQFSTLGAAALNEIAEHSALDLYPNPAKSETVLQNIEAGSLVELIDVQSRILQSFRANASEVRLDLRNLNSGVYFVRVTDTETGKTFVGKLVVNE